MRLGGSSVITVVPFQRWGALVSRHQLVAPPPWQGKVGTYTTQSRPCCSKQSWTCSLLSSSPPAQTRPAIRISTSRNLCQASITRRIPRLGFCEVAGTIQFRVSRRIASQARAIHLPPPARLLLHRRPDAGLNPINCSARRRHHCRIFAATRCIIVYRHG